VKVVTALLPKLNPKLPAEKDWLDRSLAQAVYGKSVEAADLLLKAGANPNQNTSIGTLVAWPAGNGELQMMKRLIEAGANFNREFKRETALSRALAHSQIPVIEYLEKLGAYSPPSTTLLYACEHGDIKRAKRALADGADPRITGGTFEKTPLMEAALNGQVEAVKLLVKHQADVNQCVRGNYASFDAVKYGKSLKVFELLVAAGANLRAKYYDETLLMGAAGGGCLPIVKRLVELGADVNVRDKNHNKTALDYAKSAKHQDVIDFLNGLGAKSDRYSGRLLAKALARECGGKPIEHSSGFLLNSKLAGNLCQFGVYSDLATAMVFKLHYKHDELKRANAPGLIFGGEQTPPDPYYTYGKKVEAKAASKLLGIMVRRASGGKAVPERFILEFCKRHQEFFKQLNLSSKEQVGITSEATRFYWTGTNFKTILPRLKLFESFVKEISSPPLPKRLLFQNEWLIRPVPKTAGKSPTTIHSLGGALQKPVTCPHCGLATSLMAHIDLSDVSLPKTGLGRRRLPVFWCLNCAEWDAAFFDIAGAMPKPLMVPRKASTESGEEDLEESQVMLVPIPPGKKAGRKSKLGGWPVWIQSESIPDCPKCEKPMAFVLQLASDSRISYCDMGMLYTFACPDCNVSASLIQSH